MATTNEEVTTSKSKRGGGNGGSGESKNAKFLRLGKKRMDGFMFRGEQIIHLFGHGYESTPSQREKLVDAVFKMAHRIKAAAEGSGGKRPGFTF